MKRKRNKQQLPAEPTILSVNLGMLSDSHEYATSPDSGLTNDPVWFTRANAMAEMTRLATPKVYRRLAAPMGRMDMMEDEGVWELRFNAVWGDMQPACIGFCISREEMELIGLTSRIYRDGRMLAGILQRSFDNEPENEGLWAETDWSVFPPMPTKHFQWIVECILGGILHMPKVRTDLNYLFVGGDKRWYENTVKTWKDFADSPLVSTPMFHGTNG